MPRLVDVAIPVPLYQPFSYLVDDEMERRIALGSRVVVPFRQKKEIGIVVSLESTPQEGVKYKHVLDAPDAEPALSTPLLETVKWLADHYVAPLGIAARSALPAALTGAESPTPAARTRRNISITAPIDSLMQRDAIFRRGRKQRDVYEFLEAMEGRAAVEDVLERLGVSESVLHGLVTKGIATIDREEVARDPFAARPLAAPQRHPPTSAQQHAIDAITRGAPGDVFLLHGVTGSGKTLVYLDVLREVVLTRKRTAIVLVPEIALTPQTVDRFRAVFGDQVAVLHSALSDGERVDAWRALKRGERSIAVGARSAIFAPLDNVGAIVVDEEHESSYKQNETPRYHARDVAVVRARYEGAVTVLGSATPSLESWELAQQGRYHLLSLPERVGGGKLPHIEVVKLGGGKQSARGTQPSTQTTGATGDERPERIPAPARPDPSAALRGDPFRRVVSEPLERALRARLAAKEQSICLLNRRGYSAFVQCGECGDVAACPNCSISLTYHRAPERLVCHYCGHHEEMRLTCARCGAATVRQRGLGTQQVERLLGERFPEARIARMDVDTTSAKWAHAQILDRVASGEVDILLGTQMIAKGLDFPNVTLVGVIDADVGINLPDFRAAERTFQLLAQVAGRAGRGAKGGEVIIQTRIGDHHAVRCAVTHDYESFVREELPERTSPPYPPTIRLANLVFSATSENGAEQLAQEATAWLKRLAAARPELALTIIGPAPCPIERIKNRWRWHTLLKSPNSSDLTRTARYFAERYDVPARNREGGRVVIDRDPVSLL